ncbi:MAG: pro-sigmaK processing inhibitor BofA family protein [Clostridia bacterium]|nr:pro-sigmaK processing inhibitor BofA family protein [Clostridia bacterium]
MLVLLCVSLLRPWRWLGRLVYYLVLGFVLVGGFNLAGPYLGVAVPLNLFTVLLAGLLGLPGLAALIVLQLLV